MTKLCKKGCWIIIIVGISVFCSSVTLGQSGRVKRKPEEIPPPAANSNSSKPKERETVDGPNGKEIIYKSGDVDRKAIILKRPEAYYPRKARDHGVVGRVVVSVVLSASGMVTNIRVVRGVRELNESAIDAARKIEFQPATRDGKPVSTRVGVEYTFNIY
jgi:TonB family protein